MGIYSLVKIPLVTAYRNLTVLAQAPGNETLPQSGGGAVSIIVAAIRGGGG